MNLQAERELLQRIKQFSIPNNKIAAFELTITCLAFLVLGTLMLYSLQHGYWFALALLPLGAGLLPVVGTRRRRGLHDWIAGTTVRLDRSPRPG